MTLAVDCRYWYWAIKQRANARRPLFGNRNGFQVGSRFYCKRATNLWLLRHISIKSSIVRVSLQDIGQTADRQKSKYP